MRSIIVTLLITAGTLFVVGETQGLLLGVIGSTNIFAYNTDKSVSASRHAMNVKEFPFSVTGKVGAGTMVVTVSYARPPSFQDQTRSIIPEHTILRKTFREGQIIDMNESIHKGEGVYKIKLEFSKGTGRFTVMIPPRALM